MTDYRALARDILAPEIDYSQPPLRFACDSAVPNCTGYIMNFRNRCVIIHGIAQDEGSHFVRYPSGNTKRFNSHKAAMDAAELGENAEAPKEPKLEARGTQAFPSKERVASALVGGKHLSAAELDAEQDEVNEQTKGNAVDAGLPDKHDATQYAGKEFDEIPAKRSPSNNGTSGYSSDTINAVGFHSSGSHATKDGGFADDVTQGVTQGGGYAMDPLTEKGQKIMSNMKDQYGAKKGESVFYASKNKGTISGVDRNALAGFLKDCGMDDVAIKKACDIACGDCNDASPGGVLSGTSSGMPSGAGSVNKDPGTAGYQMDEFDRPARDTFNRISGHQGMDEPGQSDTFQKPF